MGTSTEIHEAKTLDVQKVVVASFRIFRSPDEGPA